MFKITCAPYVFRKIKKAHHKKKQKKNDWFCGKQKDFYGRLFWESEFDTNFKKGEIISIDDLELGKFTGIMDNKNYIQFPDGMEFKEELEMIIQSKGFVIERAYKDYLLFYVKGMNNKELLEPKKISWDALMSINPYLKDRRYDCRYKLCKEYAKTEPYYPWEKPYSPHTF